MVNDDSVMQTFLSDVYEKSLHTWKQAKCTPSFRRSNAKYNPSDNTRFAPMQKQQITHASKQSTLLNVTDVRVAI